jgi:hypothetical protein
MGVTDFALSLRQLDRLFAGQVATLPRPSVCRVLESEFGYPIDVLLAPETEVPITQSLHPPGEQTNRVLRTVEFVSWIADQSNLPFDEVYVAVAELADKLAAQPVVQRAGREHARAAVSRAQIAESVQRYYGTSEQGSRGFYEARVVGCDALSLSIVTKAGWVGLHVPVDRGHGTFRLDQTAGLGPIHLTPTGLSAAVARLASVEIGDTVMLDNPLYRLLDIELGPTSMLATLGLSTFAAYALTADLLEAELLDWLVTARRGGPGRLLPLRDNYLPSISAALSFRSRLCAGGPVCLLAVARADDYLLIIQERSPRVVNVAGRLSVIPKAFHQPLAEATETALSSTIERELEEELLGRQDLEQLFEGSGRRAAPQHPLTLSEPMKWLLEHSDADALQCTGFGINMLSGNYEFACLATIDDPYWWDHYGHQVEANWEARRLRCYSSCDTAGLVQLISDPRWSNEGLFAFIEGLRFLAQHKPSKTDLPGIEVNL